jgi:hypothetical protein
MSNYRAPAFNPETGKVEEADWLDNHFGHHIYGVSFGGQVYHAHEVSWDAVGAEIERLRARPSPSGEVARLEAERGTFDAGVEHVVNMLAKRLGVTDWVGADGSEDYDQDLGDTLMNIIKAKGLYSDEDGSWATLAAESDAARLREALEQIAEFASGDGATLGAIARVAQMQSIAYRAINTPDVPCPVCDSSGFNGNGSGYDAVCDNCGGTRYLPASRAALIGTGDGWREIESAPKDGSEIVLYFPLEGLSENHPHILICYWSDHQQTWIWQGRAVRSYSLPYQPTFWRPLPSPPSGRDTNGKQERAE